MITRAQSRILFLLVFFLCLPPRAVQAEEVLSWKDSVTLAKKSHPDLVSAREKWNQSKAAKNQTASALFPQINGEFSAQSSKSPRNSSTVSSSSDISFSGRKDNFSYGLNGQQLLFDGFKTIYEVKTAVENIEASKYNYEVVSSDVRLRLRSAFVELLRAQELLGITEGIAQRRKQSKEMIQFLYDSGRENRGSLLTAEANLLQANFEIDQAHRGIDLAQRRLTKELGRTHLIPVQAQGDLELTLIDRSKPDFERLAQSTPFLLELIVQKEAARWGVKSSVASFFPQVFGNGSGERTNSQWPPNQNAWSVSANATLPVFEGGNLIAEVSKAKAAYRQSLADEMSGRDGVILTLEEKWTLLQDAMDGVTVQRKFLEATKERANIAEAQYSTGLMSFNDWIIIEDNYVDAQKTYLNAKATALTAEAQWKQAKGVTLDEE